MIFHFPLKKVKNLLLVGRTGSGKTSIINILNRFYEIESGSITIDGINIKEYKLENLRKHIIVVQQEVHLFSSTILENIILFDKDITKENVIEQKKLEFMISF